MSEVVIYLRLKQFRAKVISSAFLILKVRRMREI